MSVYEAAKSIVDKAKKDPSTLKSGQLVYSPDTGYITGEDKPSVPLQPQFNIMDEIEKLRKAQTQAAVASLGKARDSSLSNLSREKAEIEPTYYAKRNSASTQSQLGAKNFAEFMAGRGGTTAGSNAQAELSRGGALQGELGSLGRDEANAFVENSRRVSDVGNAYNSDVAAAEAGAMATSLQNTINQMNMDRQFNQASDQFAKQFGLSEAGLTGVYNNSPTMAAKQYQSGLDQWQQQFDYGKSRDTVADSQWGKTFDSNQAAREFEQWLQQQNLSLNQSKAASGGSGSGGGSSSGGSDIKLSSGEESDLYTYNTLQYLKDWSEADTPADQNDMLNWLESNKSDLAQRGVDPQYIYNYILSNYTWVRQPDSGTPNVGGVRALNALNFGL